MASESHLVEDEDNPDESPRGTCKKPVGNSVKTNRVERSEISKASSESNCSLQQISTFRLAVFV